MDMVVDIGLSGDGYTWIIVESSMKNYSTSQKMYFDMKYLNTAPKNFSHKTFRIGVRNIPRCTEMIHYLVLILATEASMVLTTYLPNRRLSSLHLDRVFFCL